MNLEEHIRLLDRCKCHLCQAEKRECEERLKERSKTMEEVRKLKDCLMCKECTSDYDQT